MAPPPRAPERRLGNYTILRDLAKGGMAQVFVAQRDGATEICVLKQLLGNLQEHETAGLRFHREAQLASYLSHPNIAGVVDAGFEDDTFCIAMDYILGKDLEAMAHRLLQDGRMLPFEVSVASIAGALEGLDYAHAAKGPDGEPLGIVHRDLSPRNVMLGADGIPKVIDFGVARSQTNDFRTAPGMLVGTLRYVSPEQAVADQVDGRSDIYSLSAVLHELLTGQYTVPGGETMKILEFVVTKPMPPVHELNPNVPEALSEVVARGLAKRKEDRWQTAGEYAAALREAAGQFGKSTPEKLGRFIENYFADDIAEGRALIELGRERAMDLGLVGETTAARRISLPTKTGMVVDPDDIPEPVDDAPVVPVEITKVRARDLETHLVDRDGPKEANPTRTAMHAELEGELELDAAESRTVRETPPEPRTEEAEIGRAPLESTSSRTFLILAAFFGLLILVAGAALMMPREMASERVASEVVEPAGKPVAKPVVEAVAQPVIAKPVVAEPEQPALVPPPKRKPSARAKARPTQRATPRVPEDTKPASKASLPVNPRGAKAPRRSTASLRKELARIAELPEGERFERARALNAAVKRRVEKLENDDARTGLILQLRRLPTVSNLDEAISELEKAER